MRLEGTQAAICPFKALFIYWSKTPHAMPLSHSPYVWHKLISVMCLSVCSNILNVFSFFTFYSLLCELSTPAVEWSVCFNGLRCLVLAPGLSSLPPLFPLSS